MSKFTDFFKGFRERYDAQVIRNKQMDDFLSEAKDNHLKIDGIKTAVDALADIVGKISAKVDKLTSHVENIDGRLEIIGKGTKMELFDTLYHWKKILVDERKCATAAEKKEVKEIFEVYHDELKGNGQGEVYFHEIMALPEAAPQKKKEEENK